MQQARNSSVRDACVAAARQQQLWRCSGERSACLAPPPPPARTPRCRQACAARRTRRQCAQAAPRGAGRRSGSATPRQRTPRSRVPPRRRRRRKAPEAPQACSRRRRARRTVAARSGDGRSAIQPPKAAHTAAPQPPPGTCGAHVNALCDAAGRPVRAHGAWRTSSAAKQRTAPRRVRARRIIVWLTSRGDLCWRRGVRQRGQRAVPSLNNPRSGDGDLGDNRLTTQASSPPHPKPPLAREQAAC